MRRTGQKLHVPVKASILFIVSCHVDLLLRSSSSASRCRSAHRASARGAVGSVDMFCLAEEAELSRDRASDAASARSSCMGAAICDSCDNPFSCRLHLILLSGSESSIMLIMEFTSAESLEELSLRPEELNAGRVPEARRNEEGRDRLFRDGF